MNNSSHTIKTEKANVFLDFFLSKASECLEYSGVMIEERDYLILSKSVAYICSNIDRNVMIKDLCKFCGTNRTALHSIFKQRLNNSPGNVRKEIRMRFAETMLLESDLKISEVAFRLGYSDPNNFSSAFKLHYGKTPSEFRSEKKVKSLYKRYTIDEILSYTE